MKKYFCLAVLICISTGAFSQDVFISGVNENRLLRWDDFKGEPDYNSAHEANTYWNINYSLKGLSFKGDTAIISGFSVKLELNEKFSWIKPGKQTNSLLKHEQGHFNIGLICQREIIKLFNSTVFLRPGFNEQIQNIFKSTMNKYFSLGAQYDQETDHSRNQPAQDKWNEFFTKELNR